MYSVPVDYRLLILLVSIRVLLFNGYRLLSFLISKLHTTC